MEWEVVNENAENEEISNIVSKPTNRLVMQMNQWNGSC